MEDRKTKVINKLTNRIIFEGSVDECKQMVLVDKTGFLDLA